MDPEWQLLTNYNQTTHQPLYITTLYCPIPPSTEMEDMKKDLTKMFSEEISDIHKEPTNQIKIISKMIKTNVNSQIVEVLQTMHALNQ